MPAVSALEKSLIPKINARNNATAHFILAFAVRLRLLSLNDDSTGFNTHPVTPSLHRCLLAPTPVQGADIVVAKFSRSSRLSHDLEAFYEGHIVFPSERIEEVFGDVVKLQIRGVTFTQITGEPE